MVSMKRIKNNKLLNILNFFSMFIVVSILIKKIHPYFIILDIIIFFIILVKLKLKIGFSEILFVHLKSLMILFYVLANTLKYDIYFFYFILLFLTTIFYEYIMLNLIKVIFVKWCINIVFLLFFIFVLKQFNYNYFYNEYIHLNTLYYSFILIIFVFQFVFYILSLKYITK